MSNLHRQFIAANREILESYSRQVSDTRRPVLGLGVLSPVDSLKAVLETEEDHYLPLCLFHIFRELQNSEDREFVLNSLETLFITHDNGHVADPTLAYLYAYCLCQTDEDEKSLTVVSKLAEQCFPPALATMGDGCIAHHKIKEGLLWYSLAIEHGYLSITPRHNKIVLNDAPTLVNLPLRLIAMLGSIPRAIKFIKKGVIGDHALYLDFYGIGYHLNEYWKIPKVERVYRLKES